MFESHINRWNLLADGEPIVTHCSHLLPVIWHGEPAMLKIATDEAERAGGALMEWWQGIGAAKVYARNDDAILLERAEGKRSLLTMTLNDKDDQASRIICTTVAALHAPRNAALPALVPLSRWFARLGPAARAHGGVLVHCNAIAEMLLADPREPVVLHGDIHHGNILDFQGRGWLAIDPKGLLGERGFDYANIFANADLPTANKRKRLQRQLQVVSSEANLDPHRLLQWIAAYSGLSAAWFLEDGKLSSAESAIAVASTALAQLR